MKKTAAFLRAAGELVFPPSCLSCGKKMRKQDIQFCRQCRKKLRLIAGPLCTCCGFLFSSGKNHLCESCLKMSHHFSRARAVLLYNDISANIIKKFKYGKGREMLASFAALKEKSAVFDDIFSPDIIMPVPLHPKKLRFRGFNQSLILAEIFYKEQREKIDCHNLVRIKNTKAQTMLKGDERRRNLINAFSLVHPDKVRARKIIVVDDVFTTGTTVNECSRVLLKAGATEVQVVTLARVG